MSKKTLDQGKSKSASSSAPANWAGHTFTGSASGHTGHLEMRWLRSGNNLTLQTLRYMFSGNGSRNSANIDIVAKAHAAGEWKLNSPDDRKQDGQWHTWDTNGTLALGSSTRITITVVFIFDMSGPDDRATVRAEFNV